MITPSPRSRAKSTVRPSYPQTSTFAMSLSTSVASATRSSSEKSGALRGLAAIATTTGSKRRAERRSRSSWPLVIGSKVPGYIAPTVIVRRPSAETRSIVAAPQAELARGGPHALEDPADLPRGLDRAPRRSGVRRAHDEQAELHPARARALDPLALPRGRQALRQRPLHIDMRAGREDRCDA